MVFIVSLIVSVWGLFRNSVVCILVFRNSILFLLFRVPALEPAVSVYISQSFLISSSVCLCVCVCVKQIPVGGMLDYTLTR